MSINSNVLWSLDNITFTRLPGNYRWEGRPAFTDKDGNVSGNAEESDIYLETDSGVTFDYNLFIRNHFELAFRIVGDTDLGSFRKLYDSVQGRSTSFYVTFDGNSAHSIEVRFKDAHFDYTRMDQPGGNNNDGTAIYEYVMRLQQELS